MNRGYLNNEAPTTGYARSYKGMEKIAYYVRSECQRLMNGKTYRTIIEKVYENVNRIK
jgi:hypothetical protein